MVVILSGFFRLVLSGGREFIILREERQYINSYLEIRRVRHQDILKYDIQTDGELYGYQVPKLTLQPLVGNVIHYGIGCKWTRGCIHISGEKDGDIFRLIVNDNGVGMEEEELEQLRQEMERPCRETEKGSDLTNVNERAHMCFGEEYGLGIEPGKMMGTTMALTVPVTKAKRGEHA